MWQANSLLNTQCVALIYFPNWVTVQIQSEHAKQQVCVCVRVWIRDERVIWGKNRNDKIETNLRKREMEKIRNTKTKQPPISTVNSSKIEHNCNVNDSNNDNNNNDDVDDDGSGMHLVTCNHNMHVFLCVRCILLFTKYLSICFYFPKRISDDFFLCYILLLLLLLLSSSSSLLS